jgi:hypothetical protein
MAAWLNGWVREFAARTPAAVPTATLYPETEVADYLPAAVAAGARCVKVHVQVGGFDPRDPLLAPAWDCLAEASVPIVGHRGHGPLRGNFTGLDVFEQVIEAHPGLVTVLAHAGMPDFDAALTLATRHEHVYLDTTMVGTPFTQRLMPLPDDWSTRLVDVADKVVLGSDFPQIPYRYVEQLRAIADWAAADPRLGREFLRGVLHDTPARLLGAVRVDLARRVRRVERGSPGARPGMIRVARRVTLEWLTERQHHPGGERFRLRTSNKGKRVEEGDDALVNHTRRKPIKRQPTG